MAFRMALCYPKTMKSRLLALSAVLAATPVHAVNSINTQTFNPSVSDRFVLLEDGFNSDWPKAAKYYFGANWNYVDNPLTISNPTTGNNVGSVINSLNTFDFMFGFKATRKFGLFVGLPIHFVNYPAIAPIVGYPTGSASVVGDLKFMAKIRLTEDDNNTSVVLVPEIHFPTGNTANFVSNASTLVSIRAVLERQFESWSLAANLGYASASNSLLPETVSTNGIDYRKRMNLGLGGFIPFTESWGASVEYNAQLPIPMNAGFNPNELYGGLRYRSDSDWVATLGGSLGKIGGSAGMGFRIIAGLRYTIHSDIADTPPPRPLPAATPAPVAQASPAPTKVIQALPSTNSKLVVMHSTHVEVLREVSFEQGSAKLSTDGKIILNDVAKALIQNKQFYTKVLIDGHTNRIGTDAYNLKLSLSRSKAVKTYLVSRGVPANALEARGYGYRKPKLPYSNPDAMEVNRRVEFIIVK